MAASHAGKTTADASPIRCGESWCVVGCGFQGGHNSVGECPLCMREVMGSIPLVSNYKHAHASLTPRTSAPFRPQVFQGVKLPRTPLFRPVGPMDTAPASGAGDSGFESRARLHGEDEPMITLQGAGEVWCCVRLRVKVRVAQLVRAAVL